MLCCRFDWHTSVSFLCDNKRRQWLSLSLSLFLWACHNPLSREVTCGSLFFFPPPFLFLNRKSVLMSQRPQSLALARLVAATHATFWERHANVRGALCKPPFLFVCLCQGDFSASPLQICEDRQGGRSPAASESWETVSAFAWEWPTLQISPPIVADYFLVNA